MKFLKTVFFGVLFEVSYSNLVLNDRSYALVDKDKYPVSGILQIFEDVHSPVECGVLVHEAQDYFYNKFLNVCISTEQGLQSPMLAAPGFYHYRHACETCQNTTPSELVTNELETSTVQQPACEVGWFPYGSHCYFFSTSKMSWDKAKAECEAHAAYLVEGDDLNENLWLSNNFFVTTDAGTCPDVSACSAWIGANDIDFEGVFRWTRQNRLVILPFWGALQPNDILSPLMEEDCVLMSQGGFWDDISCADANNFICEK